MRTLKLPKLPWVDQSGSTIREVTIWSQCYPAPTEPSRSLHRLRGSSLKDLSQQMDRLSKATEHHEVWEAAASGRSVLLSVPASLSWSIFSGAPPMCQALPGHLICIMKKTDTVSVLLELYLRKQTGSFLLQVGEGRPKGWKWKVTQSRVLMVKKAGWEPRHLGAITGWHDSREEHRRTACRSQFSQWDAFPSLEQDHNIIFPFRYLQSRKGIITVKLQHKSHLPEKNELWIINKAIAATY